MHNYITTYTCRYCAIFLGLFMLCCNYAVSSHASGPIQNELKAYDVLFNAADYAGALAGYERALQQARQNGWIDLQGELLNNIAAVHMATRNYSLFHKYFKLAKKNKQSQMAVRGLTPMRSSSQDNLLINGGFEKGISDPWGTGHYERPRPDQKFSFGLWWNSSNARAFMKTDHDVVHSGNGSLRITNYSTVKPHVFTTLSQRISGLQPNTVYHISFYARAMNLERGAVTFSVDAAWTKRLLTLPGGTHEWKQFSGSINIGHNDYIDFRIIHQNTGTIWLDDIVISKADDKKTGDLFQQVESLYDRADYNKALALINDKYRDKHAKIPAMLRLQRGRIYKAQGKYDQALDEFNRLIDQKLSLALIESADLYHLLGDHERAGRQYNKALKAYKGDQGTYALILNKLADNYLAQGDFNQSLQTQQRSHRILAHIDDKHGQARSQYSMGVISTLKNLHQTSFNYYLKASELVQRLDDKKLYSDILSSHADSAFQAGNITEAIKLVNKSLSIKRKIRDKAGLIQALHLLGRILANNDDDLSALAAYREAVALLEKLVGGLGSAPTQTRSTYLGQFSELYREYIDLLLKLYMRDKTKGYDHEAFTAVEQVRSRVFSEMISETRAARVFAANTSDKQFAKLLASERDVLLRVQSIHRIRERLLHQQQSRKTQNDILDIDKRLADAEKKYRMIQSKLARKYPRYMDLKKPSPIKTAQLRELLGEDEIILSYFVTSQLMGIWAIDRQGVQLAVSQFGRQKLAQDTLGIRNMARAVTDLFTRSDGAISRDDIVQAFGVYDVAMANSLYKQLIGPHQSLLRNKKTLYIVPDDVLYKIPFEILLTDEFEDKSTNVVAGSFRNAPFLVNQYDTNYLPSISVLRSLREMGKSRDLTQKPFIAFADPVYSTALKEENSKVKQRGRLVSLLGRSGAIRGGELTQLPDTRDEALFIAKLLQAGKDNVYLGTRASESNVKNSPLQQFNNVLFATHGLLAGEFKPGVQPALALSFVGDPANDGLLEMGEILGLNLNANLVVLSACNTASGSGKNDRGEGFAGLTRSFMYAGAKSLFVTLWSVESSTAKTLMQSTFTRLASLGKSRSLAAAKRAMITSPKKLRLLRNLSVSTAHPFFWAPYVLVGEAYEH